MSFLREEALVTVSARPRMQISLVGPIWLLCLELECGEESHVGERVQHDEAEENESDHLTEALLKHLKQCVEERNPHEQMQKHDCQVPPVEPDCEE